MLNLSQYFPITDPTLIFFVVLIIILFAPIVMGRLRIPHIIGMVLAGVLLGKYGLNILERDASFELFGRVGLYYIMFLAGLEMDMEGLKKNIQRVSVFAVLTFLLPFLMTFLVSLIVLDYGPRASQLLGCLMASNTLIAYPIVARYGLQRHITSTLSVGSSMLSLSLSLITMAIIVNSATGDGTFWFWLFFIVKLALFCIGVTFFVPRLTRWFLRSYSDAVMQFVFVLAVMFCCAALSDWIGLEGIFGAFFAGLILNRYIPALSPLMNRLEFTGNALFIPYFLIGVGMLINIDILFEGRHILWVILCFVFFGTVGKAAAAYFAAFIFRFKKTWGHMMFGLTSAHAAGAIAMVMVGRGVIINGQPLFGDDVLNGVVIMILATCIISTIVTEQAALTIRLKERGKNAEELQRTDDEKILIPVKYPEYADNLLSMAMMMRNTRLKREMVALNVVYDDANMSSNQAEGHQLLDHLQQVAAASDIILRTQVRIAANIANGIKHAFKEFQASEIIMGLHFHNEISTKFWGQFTQSLYNGLSRQIIIARIMQPLNTIRRIQVAVPSRAEYESGFYRWLERLARMAENLDCRIQFHGREESLTLIREYIQNTHPSVRIELTTMGHWNELPKLASSIRDDHMFVVVTARKGTISYKNALERLPDEINKYFSGTTLMIVFPDQYGSPDESMTFAQSQHTEERSAYDLLFEKLKKFKKERTKGNFKNSRTH
ncbi:MAG: cation:proton antiporter [Prevotella sp.]|nr:cation:proton antiporter [Prevotella sp.]